MINKALIEMRKAFALHIAGDQHLATIIHHGVNDWNERSTKLIEQLVSTMRWSQKTV